MPTIAVGTAAGTSIIRDNGTVANYKYTWSTVRSTGVGFGNQAFSQMMHTAYSSAGTGLVVYDYVGSGDSASSNLLGTLREYHNGTVPAIGVSGSSIGKHQQISDTEHAIGNVQYMALLDEDPVTPANGMVAYIASDYNTGWMVGDIKLATLSDTDTANVTGSELVTNGTFASNTTGWTVVAGTIAIASSQLQLTGGGSSTVVAYAQQTFATTIGKAYTVSVDFISVSGGVNRYVYIGTSTSGANRFNIVQTANAQVVVGTNTFTFVAQSTTSLISLGTYEAQVAVWDNVTVRLAEEDRSVNGNGLQVFGTVTKTAVATGADLVGYSGFSSSNYLQQPPNTDLHFSMSDDFCLTGWFKESANTGWPELIKLWDGAQSSNTVIQVFTYGTSKNIYFNIIDSDSSPTSKQTVATSAYTLNTWVQFTAILRNGVMEIWVNGVLRSSNSDTASLGTITNSSTRLKIGTSGNSSIALVRISATAPTAEQIAKMYRDEKPLFQENAQATLYGTSDAVTALAYDDDTELLHVGTSAGRSVFQGLRRVDNTTDAVGAAISASNGLVAED